MSEWVQFDHPEGLFSLAHPPNWRQVAPVTKGASLSLRAQDKSVLLEVLGFETQTGGPAGRRLVDLVVEGLVKYGANEDGMSGGRVIAQNTFPFGGAEHCVSLLLVYRDENQSDAEISVDYLVVGSGRKALYVAMKTITPLYAANVPDFERVLGSLRTPWMKATGPPNLADRRSRSGRRIPPAITELTRAEDAPSASKSSTWMLLLIAIALVMAVLWYFLGKG